MQDIPKVIVAVVLFVVILLTFVFTINMLGKTRLIPPPETVYLDLGTQKIKASISIVARPETPQPESKVAANG